MIYSPLAWFDSNWIIDHKYLVSIVKLPLVSVSPCLLVVI